MGIRDFLMKKMMERQMQGVPKEEQEKMMKLVEDNPDLFQKIAVEVQEKMKQGKDQMAATQEVVMKYQDELKKVVDKK
jgi:transcription elongation factor GreA-like protein